MVIGAFITGILTIERVRLGARPGLALITAGILIPLAILSYYFRNQHILDNLKNYLFTLAETKLLKYFIAGFCYLGLLSTVAYYQFSNFSFILGWFLIGTPLASVSLIKLLKKYL